MLGGLAEASSHCLSPSPDASFLISYKHLYMREALGGLGDPNSSTLTSSSLGPATYFPSFHPPARHGSVPQRPGQRLQPPPSQRAPSGPATSQKAPAPLQPPQKAPAARAPSRKAPGQPAVPKKTPVLASAPRRAPAPSKTPRASAVPREAASRRVRCQESLFLPIASPPQALTPRSHSAASGSGPAGSRVGRVLGRSQPEGKTQPLMLVGTQQTQVLEVRAQKTSLELPGGAARRERGAVVVGRALGVALDGLKGRARVEDRLRSSKEERLADRPGSRYQAAGPRRKWGATQQLAVERAPGRPRRPFSVDELGLARLMIKAQAKEPPLRPRVLGLPSWLLVSSVSAATSPRGPEPLSPRQPAPVEGAPGLARERPRSGPWRQGAVGLWVEETLSAPTVVVAAEPEKLPSVRGSPSKVRPRPPSAPGSRKLDRVFEAPIPLPATPWEEVPSSHPASTPISKMEARASQRPKGEAAETEEGPGPGPVAKAGSSLENLVPNLVPKLVPKLVELEKVGNRANFMEQREESPPAITPPWLRYPGWQDPPGCLKGHLVATEA